MKFNRTILIALPLLLVVTSPGCFWKWFGGDDNPTEKEYDIYGTVESIDDTSLVVDTGRGTETFALIESSFKGSDFGPGAYVHVYYRIRDNVKQVTRVFEKVDY